MVRQTDKVTVMSFEAPTGYETAAQLAERLHVTVQTIGRWVKVGLPRHQVMPRGRLLFDSAEVDRWLDSRWNERAAGHGA